MLLFFTPSSVTSEGDNSTDVPLMVAFNIETDTYMVSQESEGGYFAGNDLSLFLSSPSEKLLFSFCPAGKRHFLYDWTVRCVHHLHFI